MEKINELNRVMEINDKLIESNSELVSINAHFYELITNRLKKEERLLAQCGKLHRFLQSKTNRTWEENEMMEDLYALITHSEIMPTKTKPNNKYIP